MAKFDLIQWCNYVRGLVEPGQAAEMRRAAENSLPDRRSMEAMRWAAEVGRDDAESPVPEHAIRGAKAIGSLLRPQGMVSSPRLRRLSFDLIFDSFLQPAAGVRNSRGADRQLIFETGDFTVDVRLEPEMDLAGTALVGELLRNGEPPEPMVDVPVFVSASDQFVGRAMTGEFGDFQIEGLPREALCLHMALPSRERIELPLGD